MASDIEANKKEFHETAAARLFTDSMSYDEKKAIVYEWAKCYTAYSSLLNRMGTERTDLLRIPATWKLQLEIRTYDKYGCVLDCQIELYDSIEEIDFKHLLEIENVKIAIYDDLKISGNIYRIGGEEYWEIQNL